MSLAMVVNVSKKADFTVIECVGECSIFYVHESYPALQTVVDAQAKKVIVDLSQIEDIDTAGVQLLLWFKQQLAVTSELEFTSGDNHSIKEVLSLYHFDSQLTPQTKGLA